MSCVDTRSARRAIHVRLFEQYSNCGYWLDLGNRRRPPTAFSDSRPTRMGASCGATPTTALRYGAFPRTSRRAIPDDNKPSCSVPMSLAAQGLFINDVVVRFAAHLLYELFSKGRIAQHGVLINLDSKRSGPIDVDPLWWRRFGYE